MHHVGHGWRLPAGWRRLRGRRWPGARSAPVTVGGQRAAGHVPQRRAQGAARERGGRHVAQAGRDQAAHRLRHANGRRQRRRPRQLRRVHHQAVPLRLRRRRPRVVVPVPAVHRGLGVRLVHQQPGSVPGQTRVTRPGRPHRLRGGHTVHVLLRRPPARAGKLLRQINRIMR